MIVLHELPFMIVEHDAIRKFVSSLNPSFKMMSRKTVKDVCMKLCQEQKVALQDKLKNSKLQSSIDYEYVDIQSNVRICMYNLSLHRYGLEVAEKDCEVFNDGDFTHGL